MSSWVTSTALLAVQHGIRVCVDYFSIFHVVSPLPILFSHFTGIFFRVDPTHTAGEETNHGRIVRVTIPTSGTALAVPDVSLTEFVLQTRLKAGHSSRGTDTGGGTVFQVCGVARGCYIFLCWRTVLVCRRVSCGPRYNGGWRTLCGTYARPPYATQDV